MKSGHLLCILALTACGGTAAADRATGASDARPMVAADTLASTVLDGTSVAASSSPAPDGAASAPPSAPPSAADARSAEEAHEAVKPVVPALLLQCAARRAIVVYKAARQMELHCGEEVAARFGVSLGFAPRGHKHHEGDGKTPEGEYYITRKFFSQYHRSLELAYPNIVDADRGLDEGQISRSEHRRIVGAIKRCAHPPQTTALGSFLQIHGGGGGTDVGDWTLGCVATTNDAIEQAFAFHLPGCTGAGEPRTVVRVLP